MRRIGYPRSFDPATGVLDCSNIPGFVAAGVIFIQDPSAPTRPTIYDLGTLGLGFASVNGTTLTLEYDTSGLSASDAIVVYWDDGLSTGDAILGIAAAVSPTMLAASLAALPASTLAPLIAALVAALPNEQAIDISSRNVAYVTSDGYLAVTQ